MAKIYLWQNDRFPRFEWNTDVLIVPLGEVHTLQGQLLGRMAALGFEGLAAQVEALTSEILGSSRNTSSAKQTKVAVQPIMS